MLDVASYQGIIVRFKDKTWWKTDGLEVNKIKFKNGFVFFMEDDKAVAIYNDDIVVSIEFP